MTNQATYRAAVVKAPGQLELVERPIPAPAQGQVRIRVEACGVCHSDSATVEREAPDGAPPRVPGHEVVGRIDALGEGVSGWRLGERVGVGFLAGEDRTCPSCRHGDVVNCENPVITGMTTDGGYAEIMLAEARGLVRVPDDLDAAEAAPLLCAGLTTFNALRNAGARAGDVVAIHGLGGLGHLAVQFANKMGFHTVVIARGADKAALAAQLGAHRYIDGRTEDVAAALRALGGAKVVLGTAPTGSAMADTVAGLSARGKLIVVAVPGEPIAVNAVDLVFGGRSVVGALTGTVTDNEETLAFARLQNVRPMIETFPLEQAQAAYDRMMRADVRFRAVLTMNYASNGASA
ncbi:alcohol dehydrogenase [Burkholderia cenocepacia]|uniref:Alcohol dehydrogenase n=1 Tax=Burkholderia cenocepacia TaxID=95486 RepID=A0A1V2VW70_9BURK|nr:alcohol dehydrogenase [Burkholderia cenocepacia]KWF18553.1 alcohol dehydrogenase [Burkholderia cenocepacia]MBR8247483.1 alcohol dehydrogenase catalytic domain-containing protein [Burkholderia cenocepacia]MBR8287578.1 alcohol dehydrogenase catalytic domain-containing protein [Burkholderia cenocepacia]MBR8501483.1 alcohol dehydrogenase catalytic domain-containing protein [Burkholderia cenocepacia]MCA8006532.1 alcohol dehydrogenase [Burkholderia cenocepacia]